MAGKLDGLSKILGLDPYQRQRNFDKKLNPIDESDIAPVCIICPISLECETVTCQSRSIHKYTQDRDISYATLIRGAGQCDQALVVAGQCSQCKTIYHADHEYSIHEGQEMKLYLNTATYLKVGKKVWVDHTFSNAVVHGMYNFHASTSAFTEYWNMNYGHFQSLSCHHVWQAFVQESVHRIAEASKIVLELPDKLDIDGVTQEAFKRLGENGILRCAEGHICDECTQDFKATADVIDEVDDPAAVVGVDEHRNVPAFTGEEEIIDVESEHSDDGMEVDRDSPVEVIRAPVQMIVMDGIVMGPKHCAIENCTGDLVNYQSGVYCQEHDNLYGKMCHMVDCTNDKLDNTLTCAQHQTQWNSHRV